MRFENRTNCSKISDAIAIADALLNPSSVMASEIIIKNDWKYNTVKSGALVMLRLSATQPRTIPFFTYKPKKPTLATGHVDEFGIHLNINLVETIDIHELVGFTLHEWSHKCDFDHRSPFWTTNFRTKDKELYSVPYFLTANAKRWL
jgi:hypothetical protein